MKGAGATLGAAAFAHAMAPLTEWTKDLSVNEFLQKHYKELTRKFLDFNNPEKNPKAFEEGAELLVRLYTEVLDESVEDARTHPDAFAGKSVGDIAERFSGWNEPAKSSVNTFFRGSKGM